jgi:hypothetical protein
MSAEEPCWRKCRTCGRRFASPLVYAWQLRDRPSRGTRACRWESPVSERTVRRIDGSPVFA